MSVAEDTLYSHLTNTDSLDYLIKEGFTNDVVLEVIPSDVGKKLVRWVVDQYFTSDRKVAPSKEAILAAWGEQLVPLEIEINDEVELDSIQWTVSQLRADFANFMAGEFAKSMITEVAQADGPDRPGVIQQYSEVLFGITQVLTPRKNEMTAQLGIEDSLRRYEEVAANGQKFNGLIFGIEAEDEGVITVDQLTMGIHPGELAVMAGSSGGGKSWLSLTPLLTEFKRGRRAVLFTLENDLEMTFDRLACMHCRIPYEKLQRGELSEGELARFKAFLDQLQNADNQPLIIHPRREEATGYSMIRRAIVEGADSVIIDQLSHIQPVAKSKARQRNEVVAEIVQDLNFLISEGDSKIPLLLMHQINRKGREEARKVGRYIMDHLGEATQVENEADFVFAIYQSSSHVVEERAELQMLKGRRVKPMDWEIEWRPYVGDYRIRRAIERD